MKLTKEQEEAIHQLVYKQELKNTSLRDDIIDHLCCVVESELKKEGNFNTVLQNALHDIAPHGLLAIERKTCFLLNSKRILFMKKLMYLIGFIGSALLATGVIFKLLWYPGANILFTSGFITLFLIFIPLYTIDRYKVVITKTLSARMKLVLGASSAILIGLSSLFKIMHFQGAEALLLAGGLIFTIGYLPFLFFTMYKKSIV